jgi:hypothetical protein
VIDVFLIDTTRNQLMLCFAVLCEIVIPREIEMIGESAFCGCESVKLIRFESGSRIRRIESHAFDLPHHFSVIIPSSIEFIARDAAPNRSYLRFDDSDLNFENWDSRIDFRRFEHFGTLLSEHPCLRVSIEPIEPTARIDASDVIAETGPAHESLASIVKDPPVWWTATAKAKAVAGIVIGMRFLHRNGICHGSLNDRTILFDFDHSVKIAGLNAGMIVNASVAGEFVVNREEETQFLSDIRDIARIIGTIIGDDSPAFVEHLIDSAQSWSPGDRPTFDSMFEVLEDHDFELAAGVDCASVIDFVDGVLDFESSA